MGSSRQEALPRVEDAMAQLGHGLGAGQRGWSEWVAGSGWDRQRQRQTWTEGERGLPLHHGLAQQISSTRGIAIAIAGTGAGDRTGAGAGGGRRGHGRGQQAVVVDVQIGYGWYGGTRFGADMAGSNGRGRTSLGSARH